LLFDLDGTLVDSAPDLARAVDRMLLEFERPPVGEEQVRRWVGNGSRRLVKRALTGRMDGEVEEELAAHALQRFFHHYSNSLSAHSRLYEGVAEALPKLRANGYALGVVTNKPVRFAEPLLRELGILGYFSAIIGGDCLPQRKPDPEPLLHAAQLLGTAPACTLMVGDSRNDVEAARAAGMPVVCVPYGYNHGRDIREFEPDAVIHGLHELLPLLTEAA
jgi:phosphoglycolate phosphatase